MLFYEPLFLLLFFPVVLAGFLLVRGQAPARAALLLAASLFFYLWSEPLFVPVVLATCWADYAVSKRVASPGSHRRRWLAMRVAVNVGMLAYYKNAGFAVDNLDAVLVRLGLHPWHVGAVAGPVAASVRILTVSA